MFLALDVDFRLGALRPPQHTMSDHEERDEIVVEEEVPGAEPKVDIEGEEHEKAGAQENDLSLDQSESKDSAEIQDQTAAASGDKELDDLKRQVKQMQEEAERLEEIQKEVEAQMSSSGPQAVNNKEVDARSIYVGNVDYGATPEELQAHFQSCGTINRITILCDKFTGHPKGYAYVEFSDEESVANGLVLNETMLRGRQIKVSAKRTNIPGFNRGWRARYRGRGFRGRSRRAYFHPYM